MNGSKVFGDTDQALHRIVRIAHHARAEEQPLDVVPSIEFDGEVNEFAHGEGGTGNVVASPVDAIGTIINTYIREHHFEQGNASPVLCKTMADADTSHGISQRTRLVTTDRPATGAGNIVFGRFRQYLQFGKYVFVHRVKSTHTI